MGLFDLFKQKKTSSISEPAKKEMPKMNFSDSPLTSKELALATVEVEKLNAKLKELEYTAHLFMDSSKITKDSYIRKEPFTKTGKDSKYPTMLHICSAMYCGYSISIYYNQKNIASKGTMHISTQKCSYSIDFKNVDNDLKIMKVITTDNNMNNEKLYHIMSDGTVFRA